MDEIYHYEKRIIQVEELINKDKEVSKINRDLIFKFRDDCFANNLSMARIVRYMFSLRDMAKWLGKGFNSANVDDIKALMAKIERMDNYSPRTKYEFRQHIKKFYKWLKKCDNPEETAFIKLSFKKNNEKLPSELVNEEEVLKMINNAYSFRDRALIMSLYESGCRVGEFIKLKIKDVSFERYGATIDVTGKTGGRRIILVTSTPYLMELINHHPHKDDPNSYLWLRGKSKEMLSYCSFCKAIRDVAKRAGIKKKVNPHNFRHSRATYLANKLTEQQLKVFFGWTRASEMASVYVHLSGRDVNKALLETYGIKMEDKEDIKTSLLPIKCSRCKLENEPSNKFCKSCGMILSKEVANNLIQTDIEKKEMNNLMEELIKDKDVLKFLLEKVKEKGLIV